MQQPRLHGPRPAARIEIVIAPTGIAGLDQRGGCAADTGAPLLAQEK